MGNGCCTTTGNAVNEVLVHEVVAGEGQRPDACSWVDSSSLYRTNSTIFLRASWNRLRGCSNTNEGGT